MATKTNKKIVIRQDIIDSANAKKKLPCLKRLPELTNDMVCIFYCPNERCDSLTLKALISDCKSI